MTSTPPATFSDIWGPIAILAIIYLLHRAWRSTPTTPSRRPGGRYVSRRGISLAEDIGGVPRGYGALRGARIAARTSTPHSIFLSSTGGQSTSEAMLTDEGALPPVYRETPRPRTLIAYATNTHDHPYDEMPLTNLLEHLYESHWESWNLVAEKGPAKLRTEHASDHGLVIR